MVKINGSPTPVVKTDNNDKDKKTNKKTETKPENTPQIKSDSILLKSKPANDPAIENINVFNDSPKEKKGFGVKNVYLKMGYVAKNNIAHTGPMRIRNEADGTDVTITGIDQKERGSWDYVNPKKVFSGEQRFSPDEPQFIVGFGAEFNNNFGVEVTGFHNKVIVADYDKEVHFDGMINGQSVDMNAPLNTYVRQHEQTLGNLEIAVMPTYTVGLLEKGKHSLSVKAKLGPNLITANNRSGIKKPNGEWEHQTSKIELVGYGATSELEVGYKFGRTKLAVSGKASALNYKSYTFGEGGTGSHKAINTALTATVTVDLFRKK